MIVQDQLRIINMESIPVPLFTLAPALSLSFSPHLLILNLYVAD